ncbi:MAG: hypothetical protein AB7L94_03100 [Kofleriaceae bacterium]
MPALVRFGVPLDATRAAIRELATKAVCPPRLRPLLVDQLVATLEVGFVRALWTPDWRGSAQLAMDAAVRAGALQSQERVVERIVECGHGRYAKPRIVRAKTLADLIAFVDDGRADEAEHVARGLRAHDQPFAKAHLARLDLRAGRTPRRVKGSFASGAQLLLVRELLAMGEIDRAYAMAAQIERTLLREYSLLEIAQAICESGRTVDALRLLYRVQRAELVAHRDLLRAEIRMMVRRHREEGVRIGPAWELPPWLRPRAWISAEERRHRLIASAFLRLASRDPTSIEYARLYARHVSPRSLFDLLPRIGVAITDAVEALRSPPLKPREQEAIDVLLAEHIAMRARELARSPRELPDAMRLGLAGLSTYDNADGRSLERAWFDEGLSLSASAPRRRRVLIGVAQSALRNARSQSPEVLRVRLRMLFHLGGSLAADALAKPLAQLPVDAVPWLDAFEILCAIDAPRAGDLVIQRLADLRRGGIEPSLALDRVVAAGGMSSERADAFAGLIRMLVAALGDRAQHWLADFTRRWHARTGASLDELVLAWLRTCDLHRDPRSLLDELDEHRTSILAADARDIAERLATDARALRASLLVPPRVDPRMRPWSIEQWKSLLARAATRAWSVDTAIVRRCALLLPNRRAARALLAGDIESLGVARATEVDVDGRRFRIRVLDRRHDLLSYLRFADSPVRSCFRSDSVFYDSTRDPTREQVIAAWRDPLTMCLHIERDGNPCGFVFGSFADMEGKAALVFNGLHVRPNTPAVRERILRAIEHSICAPLQIRMLGMSNWHNGEGHLPDDYIWDSRPGTRLRALAINDTSVTAVDDDISLHVNIRQVLELYWRDLS